MRSLLICSLLLLWIPAIAQKTGARALPEYVYTPQSPEKYIWEEVCEVKGLTMLHNTVAASDSAVYSFGGFNGSEPYRYNCQYRAQRELGFLDGKRLRRDTFGYPGPGLTTNIFFIRDSVMYIGGGRDSCMTNYAWSDFWKYDMRAKAWSRLKDLPFYYATPAYVFPERDRVVVLVSQLTGARFERSLPALFAYDPAADTWTTLSRDLPGDELRMLADCVPGGYHRPAAFRIGDDVYVLVQLHGPARPDCTHALYKFSLKDGIWKKMPPFPGWLEHSAFAVSDGIYGYIGGGIAYSNAYRKEVYRYDPVREKWERITDLPRGVLYASGWHFKGETYVGFGLNDRDDTVVVWKLKQKSKQKRKWF